jgi:hypothetical protein
MIGRERWLLSLAVAFKDLVGRFRATSMVEESQNWELLPPCTVSPTANTGINTGSENASALGSPSDELTAMRQRIVEGSFPASP